MSPAPVLSAHDKSLWHSKPRTEFPMSASKEPHAIRRKEILEKHPEIKGLFRPDPWGAVMCVGEVGFQIFMAYMVRDASFWVWLLATWIISGTVNNSLQLAMHELSHDLWFKTKWMNMACGYFANLPTCVASYSTFKVYHNEHHTGQGSPIDMDIPEELEAKLFKYKLGKFLWLMLTPVFYAFRPMMVRPKPLTHHELINWTVVLTFDFTILHFFGMQSLLYLLLGTFWGMMFHPLTAHFVAEHFEFVPGQETYSYYGPGNYLTYNVGYHNEHHDFPQVPGRLLPEVRRMAPEYYDTLPSYSSWSRVLWDFVMYPEMVLYCRVKRKL